MKAMGLLALLPLLGAAAVHAQSPQMVTHGLFTDVQVWRPSGSPQQFVMLLSDDDTANGATQQALVRRMNAAGAMVAVVPVPSFYRKLEKQDGKCTYAPGAFENLSRHVQAYDKLSTYLVPMVVGSGPNNAAFAYALMAQAPAGSFVGGMSLGFCPRLAFKTPMCAINGLRWTQKAGVDGTDYSTPAAMSGPWTALQAGAESAACPSAASQAFVQRVPGATWVASPTTPAPELPAGFDAAYASLAKPQEPLGPPPAQLADLPLVELPVPESAQGKRFAVLLSGDGGWAGIDKGIAAGLVAKGVPVAGFDSLRYFWSARTPEGLANDLDRIVRYYAARWKRSELILIGYSQGADVLPFAINRLPSATRSRVKLTALLGLGQNASFEFHVSNWIGPSGDKPIAPEARKLIAASTICIYGQNERDSLCPTLAPAHVRPMPLSGGHHFGGDYDALAARILEAVPK